MTVVDVRRGSAAVTDWVRCGACGTLLYVRRFVRNLRVCSECGHHARLGAAERIAMLLDPGSVRPLPVEAVPYDPLGFADVRPYPDRLRDARERTGADEAVRAVRGTIEGAPVVAAVMDFPFLGGSLGSAAGELVTRAAEAALADRTPLLLVTASGGARMQEGALSLMQMAKTSAALAALDEAGVLTIAVLTDPTYGGVAASFATLADVLLAEPGARMGFAGPRVIEQTIRQELPADFQTAEFLAAHGVVDRIAPRAELRPTLGRLLALGRPGAAPRPAGGALVTDPAGLPERDPAAAVRLARDLDRPTTLDYAFSLLDGFLELHGDRHRADCPAIVGGVGALDGVPVMLIGHQKGHTPAELSARNFGMAGPEGYRKAARLMRLAAKLGLPVVTLIDTPGAYPGVEAEEGAQALAIAENLRLMAGLPVPVVAVVTGEGGSGGALALGVADRVYALADAVYSVISPEGCAAILWNDAGRAAEAARALRIGGPDLLRFGIVDGCVPEPPGGAQADPAGAAERLRRVLLDALADLADVPPGDLVRARRNRFRAFGRDAVRDTVAD
ncbi:hypothetical protein GCM10010182_75630 [Actinomadura cremea]|nr:hypothetical protein GCM10010182_75630 [Actinomadura cremea]